MVKLNVFCTRTGEKHIGPERDSNPWPPDYKSDALPTELQATRLSDSWDFPVNPIDRWPRWSSTPCYVLLPSQLTPGDGACDHFHIAMADPKVSLCGDYILNELRYVPLASQQAPKETALS